MEHQIHASEGEIPLPGLALIGDSCLHDPPIQTESPDSNFEATQETIQSHSAAYDLYQFLQHLPGARRKILLPPCEIRVNEVFFRLKNKLGQGGNGSVYGIEQVKCSKSTTSQTVTSE